ncbi:hypothetical protein ACIP88_33395 [Streptomyces uncialis]|uniref:hypothetical protein n=1 Tax=Streptomyces uncialis TaxID=1048205 RepID=UPI0037FC9E08
MVVKTALKQANIPLRSRRAPGELKQPVDPAWLRTEYHDKGRTAAGIARELSAPDTNVSHLLDTWGIPLALPATAHHRPGSRAPSQTSAFPCQQQWNTSAPARADPNDCAPPS